MQKTALISIRSFVIYITRISTYHASYYSNTLHRPANKNSGGFQQVLQVLLVKRATWLIDYLDYVGISFETFFSMIVKLGGCMINC